MSPILNVTERRLEPEIMDQPDIDANHHDDALRGLCRINRASFSTSIVWKPVRDITCRTAGAPLRLLDIATGAGDVPSRLYLKAQKLGIPIEVHGCDISGHAVDYAIEHAERMGSQAKFFVHDVVKDGVPDGFDIITCSLFLHHLDVSSAEALLSEMKRSARKLVVVNDLMRCRRGLALAYAACHALTRSPVVHYDGPQSVVASFTLREVREMCERAGLVGGITTRHWPFRWRLLWQRRTEIP